MSEIRLNDLVEESIVDGPGIRYVIFTQGCPHRCKGCHNPQTHDPEGGYWFNTDEISRRFDQNPLLAGITFSGGEPFLQPEPLCEIAAHVKNKGKTVVTYTGFTFEELLAASVNNPRITKLLSLSDLLIDGPYVEEARDLSLAFHGSANQRLLDYEARKILSARSGLPVPPDTLTELR